MKTLNIALALAVITFMTSCAATHQYVQLPDINTETDADKARIYVIRPSIMASAIKMKLYENDSLIGKLGPKNYLCWEVEEELIKITSEAENMHALVFVPQAGETYYIKQSARMGWLYARSKIQLMELEKAEKALLKMEGPTVELTDVGKNP